MTTQAPEQPEPQRLTVTPDGESRLAQLHALYPDLKAAADDAASKLKAVTDAIKVELTQLAPEERRFELAGPADSRTPALQLTYVESQRVDSRRLKAEQPAVYAAYSKPSGSWTLRPATGGA
ncbi:hypothetical protein GCM10023340_38650 [Nocardioides marinquilinus]|uniref:Bacterial CdiA-CT RNAse A domain-containing protein n=1 Tax=Nocardioides marinquilinus TaxID=1210400 RepID=A0ABP9Q3G3_9ACTN